MKYETKVKVLAAFLFIFTFAAQYYQNGFHLDFAIHLAVAQALLMLPLLRGRKDTSRIGKVLKYPGLAMAAVAYLISCGFLQTEYETMIMAVAAIYAICLVVYYTITQKTNHGKPPKNSNPEQKHSEKIR